MRSRVLLGSMVSMLLAGCGAKTGLLVPDVEPMASIDASVEDSFVRFEACVAGQFPLQRRSAEMLFVVDRSGSMTTILPSTGRTSESRWQAVHDGLSGALPPIQDQVQLGAIFFPEVPRSGLPYDVQMCEVSDITDVTVATDRASAILDVFVRTQPAGGTPTNDALLHAGQSLARNPDRALARYIVLATDGGPNCNGALDATHCHCFDDSGGQNGMCSTDPADARLYCLDDDRTVATIAQLAANGTFTYVVGIYDPNEPTLSTVLDRMAEAGQRPNPVGAHRYYNVQVREDLDQAFQGIVHTVARCAFVTPSRPDNPDAIELSVNGAPVARDPMHQNGWDWTDRGYGEITFYGAACDATQVGDQQVVATVMCGEQ